jgi:hypothetical protein
MNAKATNTRARHAFTRRASRHALLPPRSIAPSWFPPPPFSLDAPDPWSAHPGRPRHHDDTMNTKATKRQRARHAITRRASRHALLPPSFHRALVVPTPSVQPGRAGPLVRSSGTPKAPRRHDEHEGHGGTRSRDAPLNTRAFHHRPIAPSWFPPPPFSLDAPDSWSAQPGRPRHHDDTMNAKATNTRARHAITRRASQHSCVPPSSHRALVVPTPSVQPGRAGLLVRSAGTPQAPRRHDEREGHETLGRDTRSRDAHLGMRSCRPRRASQHSCVPPSSHRALVVPTPSVQPGRAGLLVRSAGTPKAPRRHDEREGHHGEARVHATRLSTLVRSAIVPSRPRGSHPLRSAWTRRTPGPLSRDAQGTTTTR